MERVLALHARFQQDHGLSSVHVTDGVDFVRGHDLRTTTVGRQLRLCSRGLSLVDQCQVLWCLRADITGRPTMCGHLPVYQLPDYSSSSSSYSSTSEAGKPTRDSSALRMGGMDSFFTAPMMGSGAWTSGSARSPYPPRVRG